MKKRLFLRICAVFLVLNVLFIPDFALAGELESATVGEKAANFTLKTVDGKSMNLADFHGKVVVVNFWTTWCEYCQEEMEDLVKFSKDTKSSNVELLGVNVTTSERSEQGVIQFVNSLDLPFPIGLDVQGEVSRMYKIIGIPTTYIIDREGIVRQKILGPVTGDMLKHAISQL